MDSLPGEEEVAYDRSKEDPKKDDINKIGVFADKSGRIFPYGNKTQQATAYWADDEGNHDGYELHERIGRIEDVAHYKNAQKNWDSKTLGNDEVTEERCAPESYAREEEGDQGAEHHAQWEGS